VQAPRKAVAAIIEAIKNLRIINFPLEKLNNEKHKKTGENEGPDNLQDCHTMLFYQLGC
jgi:hypothetical protein